MRQAQPCVEAILTLRTLIGAFAVFVMFAAPASAQSRAAPEAAFRAWLENEIWPEAQAHGVSRGIFAASLEGVTLNWKLPDLVPPGQKARTPKVQHQAEFGSPGAYFTEKVIGAVVLGGTKRAASQKALLARIEKQSGVPGSVALAIWGRESGFGAAKIPHNAFEVLATKAFMSTRAAMFRKELLAALDIVQAGYIAPSAMRSSWAGALGQPQFMPAKYLAHAVDQDGDGRRDIWNSVPDTLGSIANYLKDFGWDRTRGWGFEVSVPETMSCAEEGPDQGRKGSAWIKAGLARVNGKPLPDAELAKEMFLLMPAGRSGPAFLVTPNFYVLKQYNESDLYALFIGHAADRINGGKAGFSAPWGPVGGLFRSDIAAMQRKLEALGHDVGGADGLPGYKTRRSIGAWQEKNGRRRTCFPDASLKATL